MERPLRILIADDHDAIRRGIRALLSSRRDWFVCGEARDGIEAVEKTEVESPDVVLMDIFMPRLDGLAATRTIRRDHPESDIIIISQTDASIGRSHAEQIGARGYVAKADLARDLVPAIDKIAALRRLENGTTLSQQAHDPVEATSGKVPLTSVLCTDELRERPTRPPNYVVENDTLMSLTRALADSPSTILQTLADTVLEICRADSAGISLLNDEDDGKDFYWAAIAGRWKPHNGVGTPRDFGPCGDVLDRNTSLLFRHPEKHYTYLQQVTPAIEEALLVPFYAQRKPLGTLWAVTHGKRRKFDREDERLLLSLAVFASSIYQVLASMKALDERFSERERATTPHSD